MKNVFIEILSEYYDTSFEELKESLFKRDLRVEVLAGKATIITGVRRCGKSIFTMQILSQLKVAKKHSLAINFSDERLVNCKLEDLKFILEAYYELQDVEVSIENPLYIILDEIQLISKWEFFVDRLIRNRAYRVILTGSSAKLLSQEIATEMRGRSLRWELFPFSFSEYLQALNIQKSVKTSKNKSEIIKTFNSYLLKGGFPEALFAKSNLHTQILQEYFETIAFKDVIERLNFNQIAVVKNLIRFLIQQTASLYTVNKLFERLKSIGMKLHKSQVSIILNTLEDAYCFFSLPLFSSSAQKRLVNPKKIYCIDTGMVVANQAGASKNTGRLLENYIFLQLKKENNLQGYYKTKSGFEIDFVCVQSRHIELIQVCESLKDPEIRKREFLALEEALKEIPNSKGKILTKEWEAYRDSPVPITSVFDCF